MEGVGEAYQGRRSNGGESLMISVGALLAILTN